MWSLVPIHGVTNISEARVNSTLEIMKFLGLGNYKVVTHDHELFKEDDDDDDSELHLLASIAASSSSCDEPSTPPPRDATPVHFQKTAPSARMLESRILIAMYNLRSAIEEIEAARLPGPTQDEQKKNLIVAVCSLESAMDNMSDAAFASRCLHAQDDADFDENADMIDPELDEEQAEYDRLLCCLKTYEEELDAITVSSEDTATARDKETNRILGELKEEEANLRHLMNMAVAIREQQEEEVHLPSVDVSFESVVISASDNEGKYQCLSAVAPVCRHCGGEHWKYRCPSLQSSYLFQANAVPAARFEI